MSGPALILRRVRDPEIGPPDGFDFTLPSGRYAVLPAEARLRRPAISLLAGLRPSRTGVQLRAGAASWPIGRAAFLRGPMHGGDLLAMLARIYDFDSAAGAVFLRRILSDPSMLATQAQGWTPFMRQEFEFSVSLLPSFGLYVVDGSLPLEAQRFGVLWRMFLERKLQSATLLMTANSKTDMARLCRKAIIASEDGLTIDDDLESALARYDPVFHRGSERQASHEPIEDEAL